LFFPRGSPLKTKLSLTEGPIPRALLSFALPILFGNVLQSLNGSVNAIWVGKYLGEAAFAAVGNSNVVLWSFLFFGMSMVLFGVVRATGAVMPPLFILVISLWCIRVPFAYSLLERWQAEAIWWSFPLASMTSLMMASWYYRFGGWRQVRLGVADAKAAPSPV
jgi:Na+-driven multidrug efflux pump